MCSIQVACAPRDADESDADTPTQRPTVPTQVSLPPTSQACKRVLQCLRTPDQGPRRNLLAGASLADGGEVGLPDLDMLVLHIRARDVMSGALPTCYAPTQTLNS